MGFLSCFQRTFFAWFFLVFSWILTDFSSVFTFFAALQDLRLDSSRFSLGFIHFFIFMTISPSPFVHLVRQNLSKKWIFPGFSLLEISISVYSILLLFFPFSVSYTDMVSGHKSL